MRVLLVPTNLKITPKQKMERKRRERRKNKGYTFGFYYGYYGDKYFFIIKIEHGLNSALDF